MIETSTYICFQFLIFADKCIRQRESEGTSIKCNQTDGHNNYMVGQIRLEEIVLERVFPVFLRQKYFFTFASCNLCDQGLIFGHCVKSLL